jgi:vitamin-K-epoxide reductase (warfarin-sensitive)
MTQLVVAARAPSKMGDMKYLIALLAVAGIIDATMALRIHYMDPGQAPPCAVTERFDCGAVNHSRFAVFPPTSFDEDPKAGWHVPVAMFGIVGFAAIGVAVLMSRWWLAFEFAQIGFLFAAFLSYLEAYVLQKWCIYCLWSQGLITAILLLVSGVLLMRWRQGGTQRGRGRAAGSSIG